MPQHADGDPSMPQRGRPVSLRKRHIVIASNRGPVSFARDEDGSLRPRRGGGGLVTALTQAMQASGGLWVAAAMSEGDREASARGRFRIESGGVPLDLRYLAFDQTVYDRFYNGISNRVLWFVHHQLWDLPREPRWGPNSARAWAAYREVNERFAQAVAEEAAGPDSPAFLVQDYHLSLVPASLRRLRPGARIATFWHIPFAHPAYFGVLPRDMREEMLAGLLGSDVIGFHTERWADAFLECCRALTPASVDRRGRTVGWEGRRIRVGVYPISVDPGALKELAVSDSVDRAAKRIDRWLGDGRLILRVDRTDLSKNILRGLEAFELLLRRHRRWRGKVKHLALLNPSREGVPAYRAYTRECVRAAERINEAFGETSSGWQPVDVRVEDDLDDALAAYGTYDVLLVNPVFDGMNLVAKEGPLLNRKDGVVVLSENAGAFAELGRHALAVNPFDVGATADALTVGLEMEPAERARRAAALREAILRNPLQEWVWRQLGDLERAEDSKP